MRVTNLHSLKPIMYNKIKSHPSTLTLYGKKLASEGLTSNEKLQENKIEFKNF